MLWNFKIEAHFRLKSEKKTTTNDHASNTQSNQNERQMNDTHSSHETEESSLPFSCCSQERMLPIALNNALQLN